MILKNESVGTLIEEYMHFLHDTCWYQHAHEYNAKEFAYLDMGLSGESGEFTDALKKIVREVGFDHTAAFRDKLLDSETRLKLINELGDVLWYVTRLGDLLGVDLSMLMLINTHKLYTRLLELGKITPESHPWPFKDPGLSRDAVDIAFAAALGLVTPGDEDTDD